MKTQTERRDHRFDFNDCMEQTEALPRQTPAAQRRRTRKASIFTWRAEVVAALEEEAEGKEEAELGSNWRLRHSSMWRLRSTSPSLVVQEWHTGHVNSVRAFLAAGVATFFTRQSSVSCFLVPAADDGPSPKCDMRTPSSRNTSPSWAYLKPRPNKNQIQLDPVNEKNSSWRKIRR